MTITAIERYKKALTSSKTDEHYTPKDIIKAVQRSQGVITLDPCSNSFINPNVPAENHYTKEDDGLVKPWFGNVFVNPPFSLVSEFTDKGIREMTYHSRVKSVIYLVKTDNRTSWYSRLMDNCDSFCLYRGYARFSDNENPAFFSVSLFYFGWHEGAFTKAFSPIGWVCKAVAGKEAVKVLGEK